MTPERYQHINQLYHAALERTPTERVTFLDQACEGDEALRQEVESLLAYDEQAVSFIESPPDDLVTLMLAGATSRSMTGVTLGRYQLHSLIGAGGMGEVYRAADTRLDREVAVKILPEHLAADHEALRRFEREAKAVAALSHPNILSIYDFGTEHGVSYAVMELLEGETLRSCLQRGALEWRRAVEIGAAVGEGLSAAHTRGIIHRDLKPENIFLTADGRVKILDFGIAKLQRTVTPESDTRRSTITETTLPGVILGTVGYMSPEQVRGETVEATSDLFSLGCVLYEMVSGRRPFAGRTIMETLAAILKEEPPALADSGKAIPRQVERVIRHCLEKELGARYQSARELANDLRAATLSRGKISLSVPSIPKPGRRSIWWAGAATLTLLLGLAGWWYLDGWHRSTIDSLAILPMVNVSGDGEAEYLSDGITESLINSLSQLPQLRIMARSTVFTYKGKEAGPRKLGQELGVRAVLTGRVKQQGNTLSVQVELADTSDGARLWAEQYNRTLADLSVIEAEIARRVSEKLRYRLTGAEEARLTKRRTENAEAYKLYLKGRHYLNKFTEEGYTRALDYFRQATDVDPNYAPAYAGMADLYYFQADDLLPAKEAMPRSRAWALKALDLDGTLAEAQAALAAVKAFYDWEWGEAERFFKRALELNPGFASAHNQYGIFLIEMGRFDEAQVQMDRARELDPLSPAIHVGAVWPVYFARGYDQALEQLRQVIALNPTFSNAHLIAGWAYAQKEMYPEAITSLRKAKSLTQWWPASAWLGYAYAMDGQREEARKALVELQERAKREHVSEYGLAVIYAGLGQKDQAIASLERAYQVKDTYMPFLKVEPSLDSLRTDARFADLLRRMNFAP